MLMINEEEMEQLKFEHNENNFVIQLLEIIEILQNKIIELEEE
jgi:hypothetical protein